MKEEEKQEKINCKCGEECNCHKKGHDKEHKHQHKEDTHKLHEQIKQLEEHNQELMEKVKYNQAELVNYRKRKDEEVSNMMKYANKDIILEFLNVMDDFERAIKLDDNDLTDELSKFLSGFKMMYGTMSDILTNYGVEVINRVGEEFDPMQEEALMVDNIKDKEDNVVTEVLLKGYKLKDRVIRPAKVKINKKN